MTTDLGKLTKKGDHELVEKSVMILKKEDDEVKNWVKVSVINVIKIAKNLQKLIIMKCY